MSGTKTIMVTINVSHANNPFNLWQSLRSEGVKNFLKAIEYQKNLGRISLYALLIMKMDPSPFY